jgi:hypothetical protein
VVPLGHTTAEATAAEEAVYAILDAMRRAARAESASNGAWRHQGLLQYGIYKQFLSSPESCRQTVNKRLRTIDAQDPTSPEAAHLERLSAALAGLSMRHTSRYQLFKQQLQAIGWDGSPSSPRVLATIHGAFPDVHLMKTVEAFGTGSAPVRMLLATDVASEGINLHHECHHLIHYDLPWSIITLIQRNGRIDRFGQTRPPILRYLMVNTQQGLLQGDMAIFARLIDKVEEINRSTRQGETVLKLYDPEAEERYIAEAGILPGNAEVLETPAVSAVDEAAALEAVIREAGVEQHDDFLQFLLGEAAAPYTPAEASEAEPEPVSTSRLRLYDDKQFFLEGYRFLQEQNPDYLNVETAGNLLLLTAPADLRRRLGAPDERGDVVYGATAMPAEAWPEGNQFRLTDDPEQVELAIRAARHLSGYWSKELLCTDQHPILQWLTERLLMLMPRGECPLIVSRSLDAGELCFCFIGQVSSRTGVPLVVDAHAISFRRGGGFAHRPLHQALQAAGFERLVNAGNSGHPETAQLLIPAAVEASLAHVQALQRQRDEQLIPLLRTEERRLRQWRNRRRELLEGRIAELGASHPRARRYQKEMDELEAYVADRQTNWRDTHFTASQAPSTRLLLVIEGAP